MFISPETLVPAGASPAFGQRAPLDWTLVGAGQPPGSLSNPHWRARLLLVWQRLAWRLGQVDWAPDLAEDIGSRRWFRGLATLCGLSAAALAQLPDFSSYPAPLAMPADGAVAAEFRRLAGPPLRAGASGATPLVPDHRVSPLSAAPERAQLQFTATYAAGDSLEAMLARAGVEAADAARAAVLLAGRLEPSGLAPGTPVRITLGRRIAAEDGPRPLDALLVRARLDLELAVVRGASGLSLQSRPIAVDQAPLRIRGTIGEGIYRSARAAGAPIEAIQQYLQVLDRHLSLDTAVEPGDTFDLIVSFKRAATGETKAGELLFAGLERNGRAKAQLLRWGKEGQFFEASGMGARRSGLIMPVVGQITSGFGARRHPILGFTRMHGGVDFGAPQGAPIYAVGDATVTFAGWGGGHGNHVKLDHGGGWGTGYSHMSRIAVTPGSRVRAGQVIGYVGSTGLSTGPHLHYELYRGGAKVNPLSVRFTVSNQVDGRELAAFRARLAELKAVSPAAAARPNAFSSN